MCKLAIAVKLIGRRYGRMVCTYGTCLCYYTLLNFLSAGMLGNMWSSLAALVVTMFLSSELDIIRERIVNLSLIMPLRAPVSSALKCLKNSLIVSLAVTWKVIAACAVPTAKTVGCWEFASAKANKQKQSATSSFVRFSLIFLVILVLLLLNKYTQCLQLKKNINELQSSR